MKDIIPAKKESPILGLTGMGGGVGSNIVAGLAEEYKYVDELFSSYPYIGNETARTIQNGVDNNKNGGMVWVKARNDTHQNHIFDTVRGANIMLASDASSGQANVANRVTGFGNNGFNLGTAGQVNGTSAYKYVAWNFAKRKGFFDIVQYSGTGSVQNISHDLGTIPGCIMVKRIDDPAEWTIWHRSAGNTRGSTQGRVAATAYLTFQSTSGQTHDSTVWNDTDPTKDQFTVGSSTKVNSGGAGATYIAYIFAHGTGAGQYTTGLPTSHVKSPNGVYAAATNPPTMSTGPFGVANTAVTFNGTTKHPLTVIAGPDLNHGDLNFTYECWFKGDSATWSRSWSILMSRWQDQGIYIGLRANGYAGIYDTGSASNSNFNLGWTQDTWHHLAVVRSGNSCRIFLDGTLKDTFNNGENYTNKYSNLDIGSASNSSGASQEEFSGQMSNVRVTVGQAIYWSNFTPATSNLTLTSQGADAAKVQFLGLNGDANADYEEAHKFGEDEDQHIIKCGSYDGASEISVICGFEPQFLLIKAYSGYANGNCDWLMIDGRRGLTAKDANEKVLYANKTNSEASYDNIQMSIASRTDLNNGPLGFTGTGGYDNSSNSGNGPYLYIAIRKKDGIVGKPADSGTDVFAIAQGTGSTDMQPPNFLSNFPVDMGMWKVTSSGTNWALSTRLTQGRELRPNATTGEGQGSAQDANMVFDSNVGWNNFQHWTTNGVSWMWQNNQGFDVVTYKGSASNRSLQHSLGRTPEMMVVKNRSADQWNVWFSSFNDASSILKWNSDQQITGSSAYWWQQPTATHFSVGSGSETNSSSYWFMALLFATVPGISKVGSYTGNGLTGASGPFLATGFQPRYIVVRRAGGANADNGYSWRVHDSLRGMTNWLAYNSTNGNGGEDAFTLSSSGIRVKTDNTAYNASGANYVYYAHA